MLLSFIRRPVLSSVIAVITVFLGILAFIRIPVTQFPDIAPPSVIVVAQYPGANAEVCVKVVATPLERAINGVAGMTYLQTVTSNNGITTIQIFFKVGENPDLAAVNVQNRINAVIEELPPEVLRAGISVEKEINSLLMYINIMSTDETVDEKFVYNFTDINVLKELKRVEGVGFAEIMGARDYAMRVWLNPERMSAYNVSVAEVNEAIQAQNIEAAPGAIGESSDKLSQDLHYTIRYTGRFKTPEEYKNIIIKSGREGIAKLTLKDIAEVEFGALDYHLISNTDGRPSASILLKQRPGSNAKEVIEQVKKKMRYLKESMFPLGMYYNINYDVSAFLDASIHEMLRTLLEAFILVFLVVFIFLQDTRSVLICLITIPVSLIGALFFMYLMGFSINLLTLFALILAIGIVVDDAIVVVEAVHLKMQQGYGAFEATCACMAEISRAVIAITLVMMAIFVPSVFLTGPVGVFYKQFALTLVSAIFISGVNALLFTPALCALLLKGHKPGQAAYWLYRHLNAAYRRVEQAYMFLIRRMVNRKAWTVSLVLLFILAAWYMQRKAPSGFVPVEDQGVIYANVTTPTGATLERTQKVLHQLEEILASFSEVVSVSTLAGYSFVSESTGPGYGMALINLKAWNERKQNVHTFMAALEQKSNVIKDADIQFMLPPTVPGFGNVSGFELRLLDKTGKEDYVYTEKMTRQIIDSLENAPEVQHVFSDFNVSFPQYLLHIDRDIALDQGVTPKEALFQLQAMLGGYYSSSFIRFGERYKVMLQALPQYRDNPQDILRMQIKNKEGYMVPYSNFIHLEKVYGPEQLTRHNLYPSPLITGEAAPGFSSGQAIKKVESVLGRILPAGFAYEWSGMTREEIISGNSFMGIFVISLVFVYLILAAQYESYLLPWAVLLTLPVGYLGTLLFLFLFGVDNNIYAQVAVIMLMGLLGKNAILMIEFSLQRLRAGASLLEATLDGVRVRLRPILMTSLAFILGLLPLCLARGAGAEGNKAIGFAALGGMSVGTLLGVCMVPGLFYLFSYRKNKT